jgi:26S proteasome regulatory subunit N5
MAIPESNNIAQSRGLDEAVAYLLPLEKSCRVNNDFKNLREVNVHLVRICRQNNDWEKLNAVLALINKRSSQYKTALSAVVTEVLTYIDSTPSTEVKVALIKALIEVCEGKIYVEGESAHLHFMLSKIYESQGDVGLACDTIQDVHVETYGALSRQEKANYILEQIRLNLLRKDHIRTAIHSRKMNLKTIEEASFEDIKIRYYNMQIEYYTHEKNSWEIANAYLKVLDGIIYLLFLSLFLFSLDCLNERRSIQYFTRTSDPGLDYFPLDVQIR